MDAEINSLRRSQEAPGRDSYAQESKPSQALLLDRIVNKDRLQTPSSRLLQLSSYILADIIDLLADDKVTLGALALVNSTCQQLARSSQFSAITFDHSPRSRYLLEKIKEEYHVRICRGALGRCVRKFTMAHKPDSDEDDDVECERDFESVIWVLIHAMPNLQVVEWLDDLELKKRFFRTLVESPAKSVKIGSLEMKYPASFPLIHDPHLLLPWQIRHLSYNTDNILFIPPNLDEEVLRSCASTVESLSWSQLMGPASAEMYMTRIPFTFPRLTTLQLNVVLIPTWSYLRFFNSPLRQLRLPFWYDKDKLTMALSECHTMRDLETLAVPYFPPHEEGAERVSQFISRHSHIRKLSVEEDKMAQVHEAHINTFLIPLLTPERFTNLRSLAISWGGGCTKAETKPHIVHVSFRSLCAIGELTALEQLSLAAGIMTGGRCQWLIDHDQIRIALGKLENLKLLAISRDTYRHGPNPNVEEYYTSPFLTDQDVIDIFNIRQEDLEEAYREPNMNPTTILRPVEEWAWEKCHLNRMVREAENYSTVFPCLKWVYIGQRPMAIQQNLHNSRPAVVPLTQLRDSCFTYLKETFTFKNAI
ncbi:hypothetical protein F4806DRAFT_504150 [Annulohypoxylon nitens]|nr:hypothetical protein F4806DRAFT_504150 [Annulohypoxylon nitens]